MGLIHTRGRSREFVGLKMLGGGQAAFSLPACLLVVMAGLVPAIHDLKQRFIEVIPIRVVRHDQPYLPSARPMLDRRFALDRQFDSVVWLGIDQSLEAVAFGETGHESPRCS